MGVFTGLEFFIFIFQLIILRHLVCCCWHWWLTGALIWFHYLLLLSASSVLSISFYLLCSGSMSSCTVLKSEAACYCRSSSCLRLKMETAMPGEEVCVSVFCAALILPPWMSMASLIPMSKRERTGCWCKTWLVWVDGLTCILFHWLNISDQVLQLRLRRL